MAETKREEERHEEELEVEYEVLRRRRESSSMTEPVQPSMAQSSPRVLTHGEVKRAPESVRVGAGVSELPRAEQSLPPRTLPLPKYGIRASPVIGAVMLNEEGLRVSRRGGGGVVIAVKFREPIRINSVIIDNEVRMRMIKTEGVGLRLVRPVLKQGIMIEGVSISDHVSGIGAIERGTLLPRLVIKSPPQLGAREVTESTLRYAVPNEPIEKLGETTRETEIASKITVEQEEIASVGREELGRVNVVAGEVERALEGILGELKDKYSLLDYVIDMRPRGSGAFSVVDRFVRVFVHDTGWELKVVTDVCSLYAESLIGRMSEPEVYTLTKEDIERAKMLLRDSVRRGVVMEFRPLPELMREMHKGEKELKELVLDLLDRADGISYLGYLVMPIQAVPQDIWERNIQPMIEIGADTMSKNITVELRSKEGVCALALAMSGFRPELASMCEEQPGKIVSIAIGTFKNFLEDANKSPVVMRLNKPSNGEESPLHRHLKGWAIQWLINKYFRDIARDTERLKERIKVEEGGSCGVPDIFVKLPDDRKLIIEVKTLIGRGQKPVWDELYHNPQIRNYAGCADEVWVLVPPWIPILFTKDILEVQGELWSKQSEFGRRVKIVTISFSGHEELGEPIPVVDFIKRAINELKARTNKENQGPHERT